MNKKSQVSFLALAICLPSIALATEKIDRVSFFKKCEQTVKSKRSFTALDREEMRTFKLDNRILNGSGRQGINYIFDEIERVPHRTSNLKQVAYVIGTAYRESEGSMLSTTKEKLWCLTEESCRAMGKELKKYAKIDPKTNKNYVGRGYAQLTWSENYLKFGKLLSLTPNTALYINPDLAMDPEIAARILTIGMYRGEFTKYKLENFFSNSKEEWIKARKIVNPHSPRAHVTAGYGMLFYECLGGKPEISEDTEGKLVWPG
ncbi:hypothetical protein [Pseudomonas sp. LB3P38]|uniref:hypothetical protein n=1 Tax=Pseudomonas lyxosi TaxID=3398358 RepID=UPI0039EE2608